MRVFNVDHSSLEQAFKSAQKVVQDNEKNSQQDFLFHSFQVENHPHVLAAIDGSNHNIRGTNFVFSTLRTGFHLFEKGKCVSSKIEPIIVEFVMNNEDKDVGYGYIHERYYHRITGEIPSGKLDFDKVTERIRTLLEWEKVSLLIEELDKGDIIIFDGSLISGEISTSHEFYDGLEARAMEKGIALVGLSKDTSLSIDAASLPSVLHDSSKLHHPNKNWLVSYEDTHFVKFSKFKDLIFRIDAIVPEHLTLVDIVSWVGSYCFDQMLFGYPYPMQKIHDSVRISEAERDHAFGLFKQTCIRGGIHPHTFDKMFSIYHDKLDIKSFGR